MTERRAIVLIVVVGLFVETVAIIGLSALHTNQSAISLGFIVPLAVCSYLISVVTMHYGSSSEHRRDF